MIVPKVLNPGGSAGGNGTMLTVLSLQTAKVQLLVIAVAFIMYH